MPWQIWALLAAFVLTLLAGVVYLFLPHAPTQVVPLLGVVDRPPPTPLRTPLRRK
ncbi:MAG: hypothetical protein JXO72_01300 [Vicinamibacteria bacterium]|nr:hypothetical protein [Vicinamibacteria bacterium]